MFDNFAGSREEQVPLTLVDDAEDRDVACVPTAPPPSPQEAKAEATVFAVAALAAAGAFAVVGLTTVIMAIAVPSHWIGTLLFTGLFVLAVMGAGFAAVWRLRVRPVRRRRTEALRAGENHAEALRAEAYHAAGDVTPAPGPRRRRRGASGS
jgi:hypothetical protein